MNKNTLLLIAAAATAFGESLLSIAGTAAGFADAADDSAPTKPAAPAGDPAAEEPAPKRRGRPAAEKPAEPEEKPVEKAKGMTIDELRALIKPLVEEGGQGADVKKVIAKYVETGKLVDLAAAPEHHAAFVKDIEALAI